MVVSSITLFETEEYLKPILSLRVTIQKKANEKIPEMDRT